MCGSKSENTGNRNTTPQLHSKCQTSNDWLHSRSYNTPNSLVDCEQNHNGKDGQLHLCPCSSFAATHGPTIINKQIQYWYTMQQAADAWREALRYECFQKTEDHRGSHFPKKRFLRTRL